MEVLIQEPEVLDAAELGNWNSVASRHPGATFFHGSSWLRVLSAAYRFPLFLIVIHNDNHPPAAMPLMETCGPFNTVRRGVSLPFSDFCPPLALCENDVERLFAAVNRLAQERGWHSIDIHGCAPGLEGAPHWKEFLHHRIDIQKNDQILLASMHECTRRNVGAARRRNYSVSIGTGRPTVRMFYELHCEKRKRFGLPPQPFDFFSKISDEILDRGNGFVLTVKKNDAPLASAVFFINGSRALYKFSASLPTADSVYANNLVMWEGIRECRRHGIVELDLGRTASDQEGLARYKRSWGAQERIVPYFRFLPNSHRFVAGSRDEESTPANSPFRHLPHWLLKTVGKKPYQYAS